MHSSHTLLHLALCFSGAQAFYPYFPPPREDPDRIEGLRSQGVSGAIADGVAFKLVQKNPKSSAEPLPRRVAKIASHLSAKYGSEAPTQTEDDIAKRDNEFSVEVAKTPTASNSAGISQDGTDFSYFVEASIGADGKTLYMLLDTGASTTWVMGEDCNSEACSNHDLFGEEDSSTFTDTGSTFEVFYGSGSVSGITAQDSVSLAGLTVDMEFGVASNTSNTFTQFPFDGIMGVSLSDNSFTQAVKDAGLLDANIFAVALSRAEDGVQDGSVTFGSPDKSKYTGDFTYSPLVSDDSWAISLDDVSVDGNSVGVSRTAYIDTGTTYAFGPPDDVEAIFDKIDGASSSDGSSYTIPCDSDVSVALTFSGSSWTISSKDLISEPNSDGACTANIYGMEIVKGAFLLGDTFLKNVYSVFDLDQSQIGFASRATGSPQATSTSSSTSSSGSSTATPGPSSTAPSNSTITDSPTTSGGSGASGLLPEETAPAQSEGDDDDDDDKDSASSRRYGAEGGLISSVCLLSVLMLML